MVFAEEKEPVFISGNDKDNPLLLVSDSESSPPLVSNKQPIDVELIKELEIVYENFHSMLIKYGIHEADLLNYYTQITDNCFCIVDSENNVLLNLGYIESPPIRVF